METKIAGVKLNSYIVNASGPNDSTLDELEIIGESGSGAIMMKSCTLEPRRGNEEPRYKRLPFGAIQSMGLPNLGYKEYIRFASKLKKYNKPIIASVAGLYLEDYEVMIKEFQNSNVDLIEVNLSCPNLENKQQIGYDFKQSEEVLKRIYNLGGKPIGLKLPPFFDLSQYKEMIKLIKQYKIKFVSCINSVGNTLIIDGEKETPVIKPRRGGLSGEYIKPIALANVRTFYELLNNKVSIVGVGGIKTGMDAFEFLLCGADAVQIATIFEKEGVKCFGRINNELNEILKRKSYNSIEDVKGKLKYL